MRALAVAIILLCWGGVGWAQAPNLDAVVRLQASVPSDARSAATLGAQRDGNGIVIDQRGLVLTIGYLIVEAQTITLTTNAGRTVPAETVAYDYDTGFGLVRALGALNVQPLPLGDTAGLRQQQRMLAVGHGGSAGTVPTIVVGLRPFAGYWEYLLERAIFTSPAHGNWGGTALIGADGRLYGVGSLFLANPGDEDSRSEPGNMFVPIDLLKPILADLLADGRSSAAPRPWLGINVQDVLGRIVITSVTPGSPAARAGLARGDIVMAVNGQNVETPAALYRALWQGREAGATVPLRLHRRDGTTTVTVQSGNRYDFMQRPRTY